MTRRPEAIADDAFMLSLVVERTQEEQDDFNFPSDDGTINRFQTWLFANHIPQFRGGSSGPGFFHGTFPLDQKDAILDWCRAEELIEPEEPEEPGGVKIYFDPWQFTIEENNEFIRRGYEVIPIQIPNTRER